MFLELVVRGCINVVVECKMRRSRRAAQLYLNSSTNEQEQGFRLLV